MQSQLFPKTVLWTVQITSIQDLIHLIQISIQQKLLCYQCYHWQRHCHDRDVPLQDYHYQLAGSGLPASALNKEEVIIALFF